ncbi:uncharacterized protein LOC129309912 [Prosopis cineraria]|uniref:uncharacterized protein LOC129309912 n=1 Tax=Prosopis cineraria TaxID=364024 RepID=UPI0024104C21|nr:uncharacterized protein LOC129309912 [Prosopis cineraria]XP_054807646.1 uncharacterized protein LOC129309912 [Prosopis cineraria]XP_054807647.1 uncharacterized protein LOC129309912 [Prosopis cineraria]
MSNDDLRSTHPTTSLPGDPFPVPPNMNNMESVGIARKVDEKYDRGNELNDSDVRTNPGNTNGAEQEQESMASSSSRTDPVADIGKAGGANSPAIIPAQNCESGSNQYPEIQNPPLQVMERPEDTVPSSLYKIPSHVFNSTNTNAPEWSIASNESLFSIHMGTMSFTKEVHWFKSGELEKYSDMIMAGPPNSFQSNQVPGNKFNNMSQRTAEQDQGSGVTEAKAAETMREVIMENTQKNNAEELSIEDGNGTSPAEVLPNPNSKSGRSDVSAQSFAFKPLTGNGSKGMNGSSRHEEEKPKQQNPKETTNGAEALNSSPKASSKRWLSCFACCAFCR